jgi:trehalose 6-phosphate phosphatase
MIDLLARDQRGFLTQLAWSEILLAFDYDGTLAPIVPNRDEAEMRPHTARLFKLLCSTYPCAVLSGRSRSDVSARLGGAAVKYVVGNHGLEPDGDLPAFESQMLEARPRLEAALAPMQGVDLEDKRYSLALHYRRAPNKHGARAAIERAVQSLPTPLRVVHGKLVVNVLPPRAPDKGTALLALMEREGAACALYIGDDVTDEDVFRIGDPQRLVTVRVVASEDSAASHFIKSQLDIDALLARFLELRRPEFVG